MYEPPIEIVQKSLGSQIDGEVMKAVIEVGVFVDKDELVKALTYDRDQYQKGYNDGYYAASIARKTDLLMDEQC